MKYKQQDLEYFLSKEGLIKGMRSHSLISEFDFKMYMSVKTEVHKYMTGFDDELASLSRYEDNYWPERKRSVHERTETINERFLQAFEKKHSGYFNITFKSQFEYDQVINECLLRGEEIIIDKYFVDRNLNFINWNILSLLGSFDYTSFQRGKYDINAVHVKELFGDPEYSWDWNLLAYNPHFRVNSEFIDVLKEIKVNGNKVFKAGHNSIFSDFKGPFCSEDSLLKFSLDSNKDISLKDLIDSLGVFDLKVLEDYGNVRDISNYPSVKSIRDIVNVERANVSNNRCYLSLILLKNYINNTEVDKNIGSFDLDALFFLHENEIFDFRFEEELWSKEFIKRYLPLINWKGHVGPGGRFRYAYYASAISQIRNADIPLDVLRKYAIPHWQNYGIVVPELHEKDTHAYTDWAYYSLNSNLNKEIIDEFQDYLVFPILSSNTDLDWSLDIIKLAEIKDCLSFEHLVGHNYFGCYGYNSDGRAEFQDTFQEIKKYWSINGLLQNKKFLKDVIAPLLKNNIFNTNTLRESLFHLK